MPRLSLVFAAIGRQPGRPYVRSWQMQPLGMAVLAGLTPPDWEIAFFDDRLEEVDYDRPADLVGISVETYSARRGYEIARRYRARGVPVVMGGFHATLCTDEVLEHADAVCVGDAEESWPRILEEARQGRLQRVYRAHDPHLALGDIRPDRSIFEGRSYYPLTLVETGRGCPHACDFCSITAFHGATWRPRPPADVVADVRGSGASLVFFVDDNITARPAHARALFDALEPLRIRWISQASLSLARDADLAAAAARSGCVGVLVGFESLDPASLEVMRKPTNQVENYAADLSRLRAAGIEVYATFMFGYPHDGPATFESAERFARDQRLFMAAFNHLVPFPGTPLYERLEDAGRLAHPRWWLAESFRFGDVPFHPERLSAEEVAERCHQARRSFYSLRGIARRIDLGGNCRTIRKAATFLGLNLMMRGEVSQKRGLRLGGGTGRSETTGAAEPPTGPAIGAETSA